MIEPCPHCQVKHRLITAEECLDRSMTEKTLQDRVVGRAKRAGWTVAHAGRAWVGGEGEAGSWITPMSPGWPDLTLAKAGHRLIFLEIKREHGEVEEVQWTWLRLLAQCGARAAIIRPSDLREGRVKAILDEGSPL